MIRRMIGFISANALLWGGLYLFYLQLFVSHLPPTLFDIVDAGSFMATQGACWLWEDFMGPWWRAGDPAHAIERRWRPANDN
jgi:hypothetical protein